MKPNNGSDEEVRLFYALGLLNGPRVASTRSATLQVADDNKAPGVGMKLRQFDYDQDLESVLHLWKNSYPQIRMSASDDPKEIRKKLKRDADLFLVVEEDDHIIGAVLGGFDGRRGMIYHLAVDPSRRGKGIGRVLMEEIEGRLRDKGCRKYYLLVTKDNRDTIGFYESLGCEVMDLFILGKVIQ